MYISSETLKPLEKLCNNVELVSVEWLDFYNDREGVFDVIYFTKFIALVQLVVHVKTKKLKLKTT